MSHRRTSPSGCLGVLGELFTTDTGADPAAVETDPQAARVWLYPCLICDRIACPEPGEACADCAALAAPRPKRKPRKTPATRHKPTSGGRA
ncbi:MAG: hypothetical protein ACRDQA_22685 [Nocardioidaceae bacterium]